MQIGLRLSIVGLMIGFAAGVARAAEPTFVARVDRTQVGVGESFTLEITLSVEGGRVDGYRPPDLRGFRTLAERPSQSTQMQMGGGGTFVRQVYGWHYDVLALDRGSFSVGPARVRVDGRELRTEKIAIAVVDSAQAQPARRPGRGLPFGIPNPGLPFPGLGVDNDSPLPTHSQAGAGATFSASRPTSSRPTSATRFRWNGPSISPSGRTSTAPPPSPAPTAFGSKIGPLPAHTPGFP